MGLHTFFPTAGGCGSATENRSYLQESEVVNISESAGFNFREDRRKALRRISQSARLIAFYLARWS